MKTYNFRRNRDVSEQIAYYMRTGDLPFENSYGESESADPPGQSRLGA